MLSASLISAVLGTRLPGPGAVYISQTLNFRAPVKIGDTVDVSVEVAELIPEKSRARLACLGRRESAHRGLRPPDSSISRRSASSWRRSDLARASRRTR